MSNFVIQYLEFYIWSSQSYFSLLKTVPSSLLAQPIVAHLRRI